MTDNLLYLNAWSNTELSKLLRMQEQVLRGEGVQWQEPPPNDEGQGNSGPAVVHDGLNQNDE